MVLRPRQHGGQLTGEIIMAKKNRKEQVKDAKAAKAKKAKAKKSSRKKEAIKPEDVKTVDAVDTPEPKVEKAKPKPDRKPRHALVTKEEIAHAFSKSWSSGGETPCGQGSRIDSTVEIRLALPHIIKQFDIKTINDAGCGDFHWIERLKSWFKHNGIDYLGYDIKDRKRRIFPFQELELTSEVMRKADLVICRDVLIHLCNTLVEEFFKRLKESKSKYLLATSFDGIDNKDRAPELMGVVGGFQRINLQSEPFNLGEPLMRIEEPKFKRYMGLWEIK